MQPEDASKPGNAHDPAVHSAESAIGKPKVTNSWKTIGEWLEVIAIALLISLPIRYFVAEPFIVEGASMDPTFSTNQFLIVDRLTYRFDSPQRGDVIVFEYPLDPSKYYIKRIIGLPGETINIRDGHVFVTASGTPAVELNEPYVNPLHASHDDFSTVLGPTDYFVMGDNRAESSDSRLWGPLEAKYIIGRPIARLFPLNSLSILPGEFRP